ncbi:Alcohol oxidase [Paramyrothecium foliicola]|nr:Alcohol oxidase [Paramyrothecium foliicola]
MIRLFFNLLVATTSVTMANGIYTQIPGSLHEVDVIVAGGGTAGSVVAARLSDLVPSLSILVVERGPDNWQDPTVINPLFFMENILNMGATNPRMMTYQGKPEPNIADRAQVVPAGSILGGGSSINMLTYTRPQREDLDGWKMPGWSAEEILPFMNKFETYHGPGLPEVHGHDGPISISNSSYGPTQLQDQFIKAAAKVGIPESVDLQDLDSNHAVQKNLRYISPEGTRSDAAHAYLHPRLRDGKHPNLHVLVQHEVLRILVEQERAIGVEVRGNPAFNAIAERQLIKARRLVIVASGTLGSPLILERSGVGNQDILKSAGVDVVVDLPGVGSGFQDHNTLLASYYTSLRPNETYDDLLSGAVTFDQLIEQKSPMLAWNSAEITSKVRPSDDEVNAILGPIAMELWERDFKNVTNRPVGTISTANGFVAPLSGDDKIERFLSTGNFLLYPYARGHIHISGSKPEDEIDLMTGILTDKAEFDLSMAKWLYKKQREVVRRLEVYRGELPFMHPPFDANSDAVAKKRTAPLPEDVADIQYTSEDERVLTDWVRRSLAQNWHGIGTCKMAAEDQGGVVDHTLGVYGIQSLKIVDLSVVPVNMAANTAVMAFTIGEKAADIFAKELRCHK